MKVVRYLSIDFGHGHPLVMIGAIKDNLSAWKWSSIIVSQVSIGFYFGEANSLWPSKGWAPTISNVCSELVGGN